MPPESLLSVLIPPREPSDTGSASEWDGVEHRLGLALPSDYKWFISHYGAGLIEAAELTIFSPFASEAVTSLDYWVKYLREYEEMMKEYDLHIPPPGLLPWAKDGARALCLWDTRSGDPETWNVFVLLQEVMESPALNMTMFLYGLLTGEPVSTVLGVANDVLLPATYRPLDR